MFVQFSRKNIFCKKTKRNWPILTKNSTVFIYFQTKISFRDRDEIETVSSRLVSPFLETRPSRYRPQARSLHALNRWGLGRSVGRSCAYAEAKTAIMRSLAPTSLGLTPKHILYPRCTLPCAHVSASIAWAWYMSSK